MAAPIDFRKYDGLGLADLVRRKEVSAAELVKPKVGGAMPNARIRSGTGEIDLSYEDTGQGFRRGTWARGTTLPKGAY